MIEAIVLTVVVLGIGGLIYALLNQKIEVLRFQMLQHIADAEPKVNSRGAKYGPHTTTLMFGKWWRMPRTYKLK